MGAQSFGLNIAPGGEGGYLGAESVARIVATRRNNNSYIPWNKGLSKESDDRVLAYSVKLTGRSFSDTTKDKLSESTKERLANKENHPLYGRHWVEGDLGTSPLKGRKLSYEQRCALSKAQKASQHNKGENNGMYDVHRYGAENPNAKGVRCIETNQVFGCVKEANEWLKATIGHGGHISDCCKGKLEVVCGYHWEFVCK